MMPAERSRAVLILGAGWSAAAGYPLASTLLSGPIYAGTTRSAERVHAVLGAYRQWCDAADRPLSERFLALVKEGVIRQVPDPTAPTLFDEIGGTPLPWSWAVETVMLRLAAPTPPPAADYQARWVGVLPDRQAYRVRYGGQIGSPARSVVHKQFLRELLEEVELLGVITTNYDTLIERTLRHRRIANTPEPGFFYAGLPRPQLAYGSNSWDYYNEEEPQRNAIDISGSVPLCKLHGSLSWQLEGARVKIWRDMRLSYRSGGLAAIVAPTPEKSAEPWLQPVWDAARGLLSRASLWIVVGYSLPDYDHAVRGLLAEAAHVGELRAVRIHDPASARLKTRWESLVDAEVVGTVGLRSS
jgi:hypothetical protein